MFRTSVTITQYLFEA